MKSLQIETKKLNEIRRLYALRDGLVEIDEAHFYAREWAMLSLKVRKTCFEKYLNMFGSTEWFASEFFGKTGEYANLKMRVDVKDGVHVISNVHLKLEVSHV